MRQHLLYAHAQMSREFFGLLNVVRLRRMESGRWEVAPQPKLRRNGSPTPRINWSVVARDIDLIRRR